MRITVTGPDGVQKTATVADDYPTDDIHLGYVKNALFPQSGNFLSSGASLQTATPGGVASTGTTPGVTAPPATTQTNLAANPAETRRLAKAQGIQRRQANAQASQAVVRAHPELLVGAGSPPTLRRPSPRPQVQPEQPNAEGILPSSILGTAADRGALSPPERPTGLTYPGVPEAFQGIKNYLLGSIASGANITPSTEADIAGYDRSQLGEGGIAEQDFRRQILSNILSTVFSAKGNAAGNAAVGGAVTGDGGEEALGRAVPSLAPGTGAGSLLGALTSTGLNPLSLSAILADVTPPIARRVGRIPYRTTYSRLTPEEAGGANPSAAPATGQETPALTAYRPKAAGVKPTPQKPATAPKIGLLASSATPTPSTPVEAAQGQMGGVPEPTPKTTDLTPGERYFVSPNGGVVNNNEYPKYLSRDTAILLSQGGVSIIRSPNEGGLSILHVRAAKPFTPEQQAILEREIAKKPEKTSIKVEVPKPNLSDPTATEWDESIYHAYGGPEGVRQVVQDISDSLGKERIPRADSPDAEGVFNEVSNPNTSPDRLLEIYNGSPSTGTLRALLRNPNTPIPVLKAWAKFLPEDVAANPTLPLVGLEDPQFFEQSGMAPYLAHPTAKQVGGPNKTARRLLGLPEADEDILGRLFPQQTAQPQSQEVPGAVQKPETAGGLLRNEGVSGEGGLPAVEQSNQPVRTTEASPKIQSLSQTKGGKVLRPKAAGKTPVTTGGGVSVPLAARRKVTPNPRIPVAPLPLGGKPLTPRQKILSELSKITGVPIYTEPNLRGNTSGQYHPPQPRATTKQSGNLDVGSHEQGHATDDAFGLGAAYKNGSPAPWDSELIPHFSAYGSEPPAGIGRAGRLVYRRAEGIAEWINAWLRNPQATEAATPLFTKRFNATVPEKTRTRLRAAGDELRRYYSTEPEAPAARLASSVQTEKTKPESRLGRLVRDLTGKKEDEFFRTSLLDQWRVLFRDKLAPLNSAQGYAEKTLGEKPLPSEDPTALARDLNYYKGKFEDILENGIKDEQGKPIVAPLRDIFDPLTNIRKRGGDVKQALVDARLLPVARRTVAEGKRLDAEQAALAGQSLSPQQLANRLRSIEERRYAITGAGGGEFKDAEDAQKYLDNLKAKDPQTYKDLTDYSDRLEAASKQALAYARQKGRISQEQYDQITHSLDYYTPLQRILGVSDELIGPLSGGPPSPMGRGRLSQPRQVAYRYGGSTREIADPITTTLSNVYSVVKEADRNAVLLAWRNLLKGDRALYEGGVNDVAQIGRQVEPVSTPQGPQPPPNSVTIYVDGKPEYWEFDPAIKAALDGMGKLDATGPLMAIPRALSDLTHLVATKNLPFALRNKIRDVTDRFLISRTAESNPLKDFADLARIPTKEEMAEYQRYGAGLSTSRHLDRAENFHDVLHRILTDKHILKPNLKEALIRGLELLGSPAELSEMSTRVSEMRSAYRKYYDQFVKEGLTPERAKTEAKIAAAREARDLADFTRSGTWTQWANRTLFPFLSARVEGSANFWTKAARNPKRVLPRVALYGLTLGMLEYALNYAQGGQKTIDEKREFPAYVRDNFYLIKVRPDTWIPIPKAHEAGLFASLADRGIEYAQTGDKNAFDGFTGSLVNGMTPTDMNTLFTGVFTPFVETFAANKSFYRGSPIVPEQEANLSLNLRQGTRGASRFGKGVQKATEAAYRLVGREGGLDARQADYLTENLIGSYGRILTSLSDLGRKDRPRATTRLQQSVAGVTREGPATQSASVNRAEQGLAEVGAGSNGPLPKLLRFQRNRVLSAKTGAEKDIASEALRSTAKSGATKAVIDTGRLKKKILKGAMDKIIQKALEGGSDYGGIKAIEGAKK